MKKLILGLIFSSIMLVTTSAKAAGEKVMISDLSWTGAKVIGHIIKAVINGPLNSEAEIVQGLSDGNLIMAGMDKGDGKIDVYTDLWMPNRQGIWDQYIDGNKTVAVNTPYKGTQDMYVPAFLKSKVPDVAAMKDPNVAAMFDSDGNGKGEYWAGDAGWKSTKMWQVKFKSYGLTDLWEPNIIPQDTFKAQLKDAIDNQKPILFYYWTPEWLHAAYDLHEIGEPAYTEGCDSNMNLDAEDWLEVSEFPCKSRQATIYVAYSKSLEKRNPKAAKFLSQMAMDPKVINQWILKVGRDEMDADDMAEEWVKNNMATVNKWIN